MKLPAAAKHSRIAILMGTLVISACTVTSVVLDRMNDRAWLYDLAKHPTRSKWDKHIDEVVYLVSAGDKQALSAARILFPNIFRERSQFPKSDVLAEEMYAVAKLNGIEKLPIEEQIAWIRYYDQHPPTAWRDVRDSYKQQHQESFSMIPEPPELAAATAATEPASQPAVIAAMQASTAPAVAAATQKALTLAQAATRKAEPPPTPIAIKPTIPAATQAVVKKSALTEVPGALHKVPQATIKTSTPIVPASAEDKPTPPESTF